jgi:hypothetical protein
MTLTTLLEAWQYGAKISYKYLSYERFIGAYDSTKTTVISELFYREGIKLVVHR